MFSALRKEDYCADVRNGCQKGERTGAADGMDVGRLTLFSRLPIFIRASRVGLTPSPTCPVRARWFPKGDAASKATKRATSACQPSSGEPMEGFFCPRVKLQA